MLLSLAFLLPSLLTGVNGQFPMACPLDFSTFGLTSCCPVWPGDGSVCGSKSGRGYCQTAPANRPTQSDERMGYPWGLYRATCACYPNFKGPDCGGCAHNYGGPTCNTRYNVQRPDFRTLTTAQLNKLKNAIVLAKNTMSSWCGIFVQTGTGQGKSGKMVRASVFDCLAAAHAFSSKNIGTTDQDCIHSGPGFFAWHRWFLLEYEQMLQTMANDPYLGLTCWDWRYDVTDCVPCKNVFFGANDAAGNINRSSPFSKWPVICEDSPANAYCMMPEPESERAYLMRQPGEWADKLPNWDNVSACLKWTTFERAPYDHRATRSFRNCAEGFVISDGVTPGLGIHNCVHLFTGGHMLSTHMAASDPLFYLHHCMMDSIWEQWIRNNPAGASTIPPNSIPCQGPEDYVVGSMPAVQLKYYMQPSTAFGYQYVYNTPMS